MSFLVKFKIIPAEIALPINDDPFVINIIDDLEVLEGSDGIIISLSDIFYDLENGDDLSYTAYESISALEVYIQNSELYLNFNEEQFGSGEAVVTASDNISRAVASTSFYINIIEQNDPPEVSDMSFDLYEDGAQWNNLSNVGQHPGGISPYGLYDVIGNVPELVTYNNNLYVLGTVHSTGYGTVSSFCTDSAFGEDNHQAIPA